MAVDPVSLAVTAGMMAANMAMTAMQHFEGPRIKDNGTTLADYGAPLNYLVGTRIVPCSCFFTKPIEERKKTRKGKGGKQTTYTGYGTWAVHIADHYVNDILQIWFDNHLVFDATGSETKIYPLADDYELIASLRLYNGTEDQEPDPDMLAYVEAEHGAGTCPAYRGQAYIYFQDVPLEQLGNRFPEVKVMASNATVISEPLDLDGEWNAASHDLALSAGITLTGFDPAEIMEIDLASAGSGRAFTTYNIQSGSSGRWMHDVWVVGDGDLETKQRVGTGLEYDTAPEAYAAWPGGSVTGYSSYTFYILDSGPGDNEGGLSIDYITYTVAGGGTNLSALLDMVAEKAGADTEAYDFTAAEDTVLDGYNWTQANGKQICEALVDLYDFELVPHDFKLVAKARGAASQGTLDHAEFVKADVPYQPELPAQTDLPQQIFLSFADTTAEQNPNVVIPPGPDPAEAGTGRENSIDMGNWAATPDQAAQFATRRLRRQRVGAMTSTFALTRQRLALEPGDVWTPIFDDYSVAMRCKKTILKADGSIDTEWERDLVDVSVAPTVPGAPGSGFPDPTPVESMATIGNVLDVPYLTDAFDQSAPLAIIVAGPSGPGTWFGADFAVSDTGELDSYATGWDGVTDGQASIIGTVAEAMPEVVPWTMDNGTVITVEINWGELTSATFDQLQEDETLNLAAIQSGTGWEIVQFANATLVDTRTYELSGFFRGMRGTEWTMAGHAINDRFILLDTPKVHTMGASEIGDTDYYVIHSVASAVDQDAAVPLAYTGASHKPYAPVLGTQEASGADLVFDATRRTRIGGANLDGQDVPLGEASESWALDIYDGLDVVRTITGTALPLTYLEVDQITDFGSARASVDAQLYQVNPTLSLRGYPLAFAA